MHKHNLFANRSVLLIFWSSPYCAEFSSLELVILLEKNMSFTFAFVFIPSL